MNPYSGDPWLSCSTIVKSEFYLDQHLFPWPSVLKPHSQLWLLMAHRGWKLMFLVNSWTFFCTTTSLFTQEKSNSNRLINLLRIFTFFTGWKQPPAEISSFSIKFAVDSHNKLECNVFGGFSSIIVIRKKYQIFTSFLVRKMQWNVLGISCSKMENPFFNFNNIMAVSHPPDKLYILIPQLVRAE